MINRKLVSQFLKKKSISPFRFVCTSNVLVPFPDTLRDIQSEKDLAQLISFHLSFLGDSEVNKLERFVLPKIVSEKIKSQSKITQLHTISKNTDRIFQFINSRIGSLDLLKISILLEVVFTVHHFSIFSSQKTKIGFNFNKPEFLDNFEKVLQKTENLLREYPQFIYNIFLICFSIHFYKKMFDLSVSVFLKINPNLHQSVWISSNFIFRKIHAQKLFEIYRRLFFNFEKLAKQKIISFAENSSPFLFEEIVSHFEILQKSQIFLDFDFFVVLIDQLNSNWEFLSEEQMHFLMGVFTYRSEYSTFPVLNKNISELCYRLFEKYPGETDRSKALKFYQELKLFQCIKHFDKFLVLVQKMSEEDLIGQHFNLYLIFYLEKHFPESFEHFSNEEKEKIKRTREFLSNSRTKFKSSQRSSETRMQKNIPESLNASPDFEFLDLQDVFRKIGLQSEKESFQKIYFFDFYFPDFHSWAAQNLKNEPEWKNIEACWENYKHSTFLLEIQGPSHYDCYFKYENRNSKFKRFLLKDTDLFVMRITETMCKTYFMNKFKPKITPEQILIRSLLFTLKNRPNIKKQSTANQIL